MLVAVGIVNCPASAQGRFRGAIKFIGKTAKIANKNPELQKMREYPEMLKMMNYNKEYYYYDYWSANDFQNAFSGNSGILRNRIYNMSDALRDSIFYTENLKYNNIYGVNSIHYFPGGNPRVKLLDIYGNKRSHDFLGRDSCKISPDVYTWVHKCLGDDSWEISPDLETVNISSFKRQNDTCKFGYGFSSSNYILSKESFWESFLIDGSNLNYMYVKNGHLHWKKKHIYGIESGALDKLVPKTIINSSSNK